MNLVITIVVVFLMLVASEYLWRTKRMRGEAARKLVHISIGTFAAFWPYFLTWPQIRLLSLAGFLLVLIAGRFKFFHVGYDVKRHSWGELFFPAVIGIGAVIAPAPIVFTAAILHLSLADGLAAVVGKKYGLLHQYRIRHYTKTLAGTLTFWLTSLLIVSTVIYIGTGAITVSYLPLIIWLPLAAAFLENISPVGLDNLFVPLLVLIVLQAAKI